MLGKALIRFAFKLVTQARSRVSSKHCNFPSAAQHARSMAMSCQGRCSLVSMMSLCAATSSSVFGLYFSTHGCESSAAIGPPRDGHAVPLVVIPLQAPPRRSPRVDSQPQIDADSLQIMHGLLHEKKNFQNTNWVELLALLCKLLQAFSTIQCPRNGPHDCVAIMPSDRVLLELREREFCYMGRSPTLR